MEAVQTLNLDLVMSVILETLEEMVDLENMDLDLGGQMQIMGKKLRVQA